MPTPNDNDRPLSYEIKNSLSLLTTYIEEIENLKIKIDITLKTHEEKINSLLPNTISTMGVFIAIITIVFGGFTLINAFEAMANQTEIRLYFSIILTGQMILNVIFLLMFLISRLSDKRINNICKDFSADNGVTYMIQDYYDEEFWKEINSDIEAIENPTHKYLFKNLFEKIGINFSASYKLDTNKMHCVYCKNNKTNAPICCGTFRKAMKKYPYIYIANITIFMMEIILGIVYLYDWISQKYNLNSPISFVVSISTIIGVFFFGFIYLLYNVGTHDDKKQDEIYKRHIYVVIVAILLLFFSCFLLTNITFTLNTP